MKKSFLTISVDDGHPTDFKTADLLESFGLKATFYIPKLNPERPVITESQIQDLSKRFEIGGHTLSHLSLHKMSEERVWNELSGGKKWLEDCTGLEAVSFCYPQGKFTSNTLAQVKKAGFLGARTCYFNLNDLPKDPFCMGVSTHAYSHSKAIQFRHAIKEGNFEGAKNFFTIFKGATDWEEHFSHALDWTEKNGGVAHLYFHSWEIDAMKQWDKLERVLKKASERKNHNRVTNGELFKL